jgi:hypothetical protein
MKSKSEAFVSDFSSFFRFLGRTCGQRALVTFPDLLSLPFLSPGPLA